MAIERILLTTTGHVRLQAEFQKLKTETRPHVVQELSDARAHGDLSENAEYHAAKENLRCFPLKLSFPAESNRACVSHIDMLASVNNNQCVCFNRWLSKHL